MNLHSCEGGGEGQGSDTQNAFMETDRYYDITPNKV